MIEPADIITFLLMGCVTWLTRIMGYLVLHTTGHWDQRTRAVMEAAPGCVLITVIAPYFASDRPADLIALAITLIFSARFSFLPTVLAGIASAFLLRHLM